MVYQKLLGCIILLASMLAPFSVPAQEQSPETSSIGYLMLEKNDGAVDDIAQIWFKKPVPVYEKPQGTLIGYVHLQCTPLEDGAACDEPTYEMLSPDRASTAEIDLDTSAARGCYTNVLLVSERDKDWYHISAGWVKAPKNALYKTWEEHFTQTEPTAYPFPLVTDDSQPLRLDPNDDAKLLNDPHTGKQVDVSGMDIHILYTKGNFALVLVSDKDVYCEENLALTGMVGWIHILDKDGHPFLHSKYGCC
jgi:hypothetical protein